MIRPVASHLNPAFADDALSSLLDDIKREKTPQRLLILAEQLEDKLSERRSTGACAESSTAAHLCQSAAK